jgi:septum formation protein
VRGVIVVLASASPARRTVLRNAGIEPVVRVSGVDEDAVAAALGDATPEELVAALAEAKANAVVDAVAAEFPTAVVLGCDSMLVSGYEVHGKPGTVERARERWAAMAGTTGSLVTGHAVLRLADGAVAATATGTIGTLVRIGTPSERELDTYLASGEPLHVAGGFTIDGLGGWFVEGVTGDPSNVIGISLPLTRDLLAKVGVTVTDLWTGSAGA